jgi:hypothetical protein
MAFFLQLLLLVNTQKQLQKDVPNNQQEIQIPRFHSIENLPNLLTRPSICVVTFVLLCCGRGPPIVENAIIFFLMMKFKLVGTTIILTA